MKFLLVEDNERLAVATRDRLTMDGHAVDHARGVQDGFDHIAASDYDVILLDIMLPDGDGRDFLRRHRANSDTPVIALTARSDIGDRVSVLDLGADDYIVKPFDFAELEARCRAVYRRRGGFAPDVVTVGDVTFDRGEARLRIGEDAIPLRNRELRLAEVLFNTPGQIFSKAQLVDRLFGFDELVSENAIEVYIGRLRRHLATSSISIETCRGLGYRLLDG
ncbi:MAG: response regulator transcription factor [Pseudomonadota bacterium]